MTDKQANRIMAILFWVIALAVVVGCCCGCADFAFVHKSQIHTTIENFKVYQKYTEPTEEPEKVNELADLIQKTLEAWKGDWDAK